MGHFSSGDPGHFCTGAYKDGKCGKQRLVVACDFQSFMANVGTLFPRAKVRTTTTGASGSTKWAERVIALLNASTAAKVTTGELGKLLGKAWRSVRFAVLTPEFYSALEGIGWRYVAGKGRRAGYFERRTMTTTRSEALAA